LENYVKCIENDSKMIPQGSYETKYISYAYNKLMSRTAVNFAVLRHKAEHDALTGVINREGLKTILDALEHLPEPIAYLIVDIDLFKKINDTYGHVVGDEVLKAVAEILMEQFRSTDYVARTGGDEFAIVMTKCGTSPIDIIMNKVNSINDILQNSMGHLPAVSLSVGVAFNDSGYTPDLVKRADEALYKVKRGGRCNCAFYSQDDKDNADNIDKD
jgi:diguanylate cyclase (GGDEF)-like protein